MAIGNIYIALVDAGEEFDPNVHNREDEDVFHLRISQSEGEFARAEIEIRNPRKGLLSPSRKRWIFISHDVSGTAQLMFSGRVVGYPSDLSQETITLEYIAQPENWESDQQTFLDSLKISPFYNELFFSEDRRDDLASILSARSALLNWDRKTGAISLSDIIEGSEFIDLGENILFDTVRTELGDPPLQRINLAIEVQWEQLGFGIVNCEPQIRAAFTNSAIPTAQINTLTPLAFESGWQGASIPAGYSQLESKLVPIADGHDLEQADLRSGLATVSAVDFPRANGDTTGNREVSVPRVWYEGTFKLQASYEQKRREIFSSTLEVATQEFALKGNRTEDIAIRLQNPTAVAQGEILDVAEPSFYFDPATSSLTAYGEEAIEHAFLRARARLIKASRIVEARFSTDIENIIDVSCDHSLRIQDDRIPGGSLRGKVLYYSLSWDGDSGQQVGEVTLGACLGTGVDSTGSGSPTEVELNPVDYPSEHGTDDPTHSSIFYDIISPTIDEPVDVSQMESDDEYLIEDVTVDNNGETQNTNFIGTSHPDTYLKDYPTGVEVSLKTMRPEAELFKEISADVEPLTLPRNVDLEAT
jgi:hypothetical protein